MAPSKPETSATATAAQSRNVYVAGLPSYFDSDKLVDLFRRFGPIVSCRVFDPSPQLVGLGSNSTNAPSPYGRNSPGASTTIVHHSAAALQNRRMGFVLFIDALTAQRAITAMDGHVLAEGAAPIVVRLARSRDQPSKTSMSATDVTMDRTPAATPATAFGGDHNHATTPPLLDSPGRSGSAPYHHHQAMPVSENRRQPHSSAAEMPLLFAPVSSLLFSGNACGPAAGRAQEQPPSPPAYFAGAAAQTSLASSGSSSSLGFPAGGGVFSWSSSTPLQQSYGDVIKPSSHPAAVSSSGKRCWHWNPYDGLSGRHEMTPTA